MQWVFQLEVNCLWVAVVGSCGLVLWVKLMMLRMVESSVLLSGCGGGGGGVGGVSCLCVVVVWVCVGGVGPVSCDVSITSPS